MTQQPRDDSAADELWTVGIIVSPNYDYDNDIEEITVEFGHGDVVIVGGTGDSESVILKALQKGSSAAGFTVFHMTAEEPTAQHILKRDRNIVDAADEVILFWNGTDTAMFNTVEYAIMMDKYLSYVVSNNTTGAQVGAMYDFTTEIERKLRTIETS